MSIIVWIIFGALAGWVASMVAGTDARQGAFANIVVGILGSFLGGFLMSLIGKSGVTGFNLYSAIVAVLGSVVLLTIYKAVMKNA
ncbi:GlsB/YeaQ/YmgE family stress response membrane protein [Candidatus Saccharibacteria bacterium]|jgi:uncharacterized membrane protein YeaQ/YmgE (transglycosylase-associated protein family)|nr:GlsB/YeaQ/YmgE family stress response membrane protein [Candidatus Saccharibacteria bacterium]